MTQVLCAHHPELTWHWHCALLAHSLSLSPPFWSLRPNFPLGSIPFTLHVNTSSQLVLPPSIVTPPKRSVQIISPLQLLLKPARWWWCPNFTLQHKPHSWVPASEACPGFNRCRTWLAILTSPNGSCIMTVMKHHIQPLFSTQLCNNGQL